jgi:hypothetical protein
MDSLHIECYKWHRQTSHISTKTNHMYNFLCTVLEWSWCSSGKDLHLWANLEGHPELNLQHPQNSFHQYLAISLFSSVSFLIWRKNFRFLEATTSLCWSLLLFHFIIMGYFHQSRGSRGKKEVYRRKGSSSRKSNLITCSDESDQWFSS